MGGRVRVLVYGLLWFIASLTLVDTNIGRPVTAIQRRQLSQAIDYIDSRGLHADARELRRILRSDGFRSSSLIRLILMRRDSGSLEPEYYAYTPVLSRSVVFLGGSFWQTEEPGRASVLVHELQHIRSHRENALQGLRRSEDEDRAYTRQYATHTQLGLKDSGESGVVYWDMMIGIRAYVLPRHPYYARRTDIRRAMEVLNMR